MVKNLQTRQSQGNTMESSAHRRILWPTLGGMALGFFVIQPLIVLVYNLAPKTRLAFHDLSCWKRLLDMSLAEQMESARRLAALDTLQALMVTLAHYIRNANLVIGGFSDQLRRHAADPKEKEHLELVHQASREIDAVIDSLQSLTQISATQYIVGGTARMIDLKKELDQRLAASSHPGRRQEEPDTA
jgi:signal transduction histidine kinase